MNRRLFGILTAMASLSACAGAPLASSTQSRDWDEINRTHDAARVSDEAPLTVDEMMMPRQLAEFARESCGIERELASAAPSERMKCDAKLKQAVFSEFSSRYFNADHKAIEARCEREKLACHDPKILELWIRASHNEGIEASRKEKLAGLDHESRAITGGSRPR